MCDLLWQNAPRILQLCLHRRLTPRCAKGSCVTKNKPCPEEPTEGRRPEALEGRRTATSEIVVVIESVHADCRPRHRLRFRHRGPRCNETEYRYRGQPKE